MATTTQSHIVAVFRSSSDAQAAASELRSSGIPADDIYISSYSDTGTTGSATAAHSQTGQHEGGIKGWFKSLFGDDDQDATYRDRYDTAVQSGGVLLSVAVPEQSLDEVVDILDKYNPVDVNETAGGSTAANAGTATTSTAATTSATAAASTTGGKRGSKTTAGSDLPTSIPVVQEDLRVGKRTVGRGAVRIYSRVVERPVEETINLREEHVRVERQPVNRAAQPGDIEAGREQVIEVQEFAEEPVVSKEARVVEEVRVSKDASERQQTVRDTVRHTEVSVEGANQGSATASYDDDFRRDYQTRYGSVTGSSYDDYAPAYQYGYQAASDPRYQGRSWDQVESDLQSDYGRRYPNSTWERMKDSIRYGWDKVTGRAKSASTSRQ